MSKDEIIAAQYQALVEGRAEADKAALGACVDAGVEIGKAEAGPSGFSQEQVDAFLAAQKAQFDADFAADEAADEAALKSAQDALASADAALVEQKAQYDGLAAKEKVEADGLAALQASADKLQQALDAIRSVLPGLMG